MKETVFIVLETDGVHENVTWRVLKRKESQLLTFKQSNNQT